MSDEFVRPTLVVAFNAGLATGIYVLSKLWLPALLDILCDGIPFVGTATNERDCDADVQLLEQLGARFVVPRYEEAFRALVPFSDEPPPEGAPPSHSNMHLYALQGSHLGADVWHKDEEVLAKLHEAAVDFEPL